MSIENRLDSLFLRTFDFLIRPNEMKMKKNRSFSSKIDENLLTLTETISDNELFVCSICSSIYKNDKKHRLVSTECGHLFGKSCIRKSFKQAAQCPICLKDLTTRKQQQLRTMCLSSVVTIFPIEIFRMRDERRQLKLELNRLKQRFRRVKSNINDTRRFLRSINEKLLQRRKSFRRRTKNK